MKFPRFLAAIPVLLLPLVLLADDQDSPVQKEMGQISRNLRQLSHQYADPAQQASSLALVAAVQKSIANAKTLTPSTLQDVPAADQAKYLETYKKDLDALDQEMTALKDDLAGGKTDLAKAEMDKIFQLKKSSHQELGVGKH